MSNQVNIRNLSQDEYFFGHKACPGCGGSLATRMALKTLGENTVSVLPAGCMSAVGFVFPQLAFLNNSIISTFAGTASLMSGITAGAKALGLDDIQVLGIAGDGGTADIGIQALSGSIDRDDDQIYICYDNEAYMNTGIQKSGLTPLGATTTTTPDGELFSGNTKAKKNMFEIVAAHGIGYAATASVGYIDDFIRKVQKAKDHKGASYIHVIAPCPVGWGTDSSQTIDLGVEIVENGLWYLAEYENGEFILNKDPKVLKPVDNYIKRQARYSHLTDKDIKNIQDSVDEKWKNIRKNWRIQDGNRL